MRTACLVGIFLTCMPVAQLFGQQPASEEAGITPFGSYSGSSVESVNNKNGRLVIDIPLYSLPQRGRLKLSYSLTYQNVGYKLIINCGTGGPIKSGCDSSTEPTNSTWGVYPILDQGVIDVSETSAASGATADNGTGVYYTEYSLRDRTGATHVLAYAGGTTYHTFDGSQWSFIYSGANPPYWPLSNESTTTVFPPGTIIDSDGNRYSQGESGAVWITDVDGNQMTSSASGIVDSVNRTIPGIPPPTASTSGCPSINAQYQTLTSSATWTVPGYQGSVSYLFCYATMYISTGVSAPPDNNQYHLTATVLQSVVLPDGTYWGFVYAGANPSVSTSIGYGDLVQTIFPTGGSANYTWGPPPGTTRTVSARALVANGNTSTWNYAYNSVLNDSSGYTTTVTDPLGNQTVHTFTDVSGDDDYLYETGTAYNQITSTGSQANLKTVTTQYQVVNPPNYQYAMAALPTKITTTWPNGQSSYTAFTYDSGVQYSEYLCFLLTTTSWSCSGSPDPTPTPFGKATSQTTYDYSGSLLSETQTQYLWQTNSSYIAANLFNTPSSVTVSGPSGQVAQTLYTYDESSKVRLAPSPAITTQVGAAPGSVYGHVTTTAKWLNSGGANPSISTYWLNTGEVDHTIDANGNTTSYLYSSAYAGAYPTLVTNALKQSNTAAYDLNSGLKTSTTDPNKQITSYTYDVMNRPRGISYPDGGQSTFSYNLPSYPQNSVLVQTLMCSGSSNCSSATGETETTLSVYDGLGRPSTTELLSDPAGTDYTVTSYDLLGRVSSVTNPYRSTTDPTYGITSYTYDALGRKLYQCQPDNTPLNATTCAPNNSYLQWSYAGNVTTAYDELRNSWQSTNDTLGRLTNVVEPGGLATNYSYDALGNLWSVSQKGNGTTDTPRTRSFAYDSLSRLLCASNPENSQNACPASATAAMPSGVIGYAYDANGNLSSKTDARSITTNYKYDALNRLLSKTYTNDTTGTASSCYQYDGASTANLVGRLVNQWTQKASSGVCAATLPSTGYLTLRSILAYDSMGRVQNEQQCTKSNCVTGTPYKPAYTYDLAGNILTHGNGIGTMTFTNCYDAASHLLSVVNANTTCSATLSPSTTLFSAPGYSPAGGLTAATFGTALKLSRSYDSHFRVTGETDIGNAAASTPGSATLTITGTEHVQ